MTPRAAMARSRSAPARSKASVTSPPSPLAATVGVQLGRAAQARSFASPNATRSPTASRWPGLAKRRPARGRETPQQRRLARRRQSRPRERTPRRRAAITRVSLNTSASPGAQQVRQVADVAIVERAARIHHQQPRGVARRGGPAARCGRPAARNRSRRGACRPLGHGRTPMKARRGRARPSRAAPARYSKLVVVAAAATAAVTATSVTAAAATVDSCRHQHGRCRPRSAPPPP